MDRKAEKLQINEVLCIWRLIGCCGVFVVHLGQQMQFSGMLRTITDLGQNGIYVFFILSGYLAYATYNKSQRVSRYYIKRAIKILPLYYLVICYYFIRDTFVYDSVPTDETGLYWLRYVFFLFGLIKAENNYWMNLGAVWTVAVFVVFYITMPLLYRKIDSFEKSLVLLVTSGIVRELILVGGNGNWMAIEYLFFVFFGITLYLGIVEKKLLLLGVIMVLGTIGFVVLGRIEIAAPFFLSLMILLTINLHVHNEKLKAFIIRIDCYTYAAYLLQMIVFTDIMNNISENLFLNMIVAIVCEVLLCILVVECFEKPIQKFLYKKVFSKC